MRESDYTKRIFNFVINNIYGNDILEIGCGNCQISIDCVRLKKRIVATDISFKSIERLKRNVLNMNIEFRVENVEHLSFEDKAFDTIVCINTLEHIRDLYSGVNELKRVEKNRIIIVVPKQRYFKYTCDYHLNFFYGE